MREYLRVADLEVWQHLEKQGLTPTLYALRWVTLILCQEFGLPDVLRIWDSILSKQMQVRLRFLLHLCCAMVINIRDEILRQDFAENLTRLQRYPRDIDVEDIIYSAERLQEVTQPLWKKGKTAAVAAW